MRTIIAIIAAMILWLCSEVVLTQLQLTWAQKLVSLFIVAPLIGLGLSRDRLAQQRRANRRFQKKMLEMYEIMIYIKITHEKYGDDVFFPTRPKFGHRQSEKCVVLFLRPFEFDKQLRVKNLQIDVSPVRHFIPHFSIIVGATRSLDAALAEAIKGYGELVAIGNEVGNVGATLLETDELDWRQHFAVLADSASAIVVCTSFHAGTAWEMEQICSSADLLKKSVFIMPPGIVDEEVRGVNIKWSIKLLRRYGCHVPKDVKEGECIAFDADKMPALRKQILMSKSLLSYELNSEELKEIIEKIGV